MPQSVRFVTDIQNWSPERICLKFTLLFLLVLVWVEAEKCVQLSKTGRFEMNWYMLLIANWVFRLDFYAYLSHLWSPLDAKYMHAYTTQTIREIRPAVLAVEKTSTYCNPTNPRCFSEENNSDPLSADGGRSTGWVGRGPRWFCMTKGHIWHRHLWNLCLIFLMRASHPSSAVKQVLIHCIWANNFTQFVLFYFFLGKWE